MAEHDIYQGPNYDVHWDAQTCTARVFGRRPLNADQMINLAGVLVNFAEAARAIEATRAQAPV